MSCQISSTGSASPANQVYAQNAKQASAPPTQQQQPDSVSLSKQAQSSVDVDHDGDSH
jgi:anti-sigma28 factor (negative regulator of flagellin synthesis)